MVDPLLPLRGLHVFSEADFYTDSVQYVKEVQQCSARSKHGGSEEMNKK